MGTYTTNYQLYTPTVGETGWGTLVNGNFTTIDTTMKSLSNRITAVENGLNGPVNISTSVTSGDIKLGVLSYNNPSIGSTAFLTSKTCTCNVATFTKKNTSLVNYIGPTPSNSSTCTITVSIKNSSGSTSTNSCSVYVTVKNTTTGATIMSNKSLTATYVNEGVTRTVTTTFTRVPTNTYSITVVGYQIINMSGSEATSGLASIMTYSVSTSTPNTTLYLP